jgi:hypothetical protein
MRWNNPDAWVWSEEPAHEAIIHLDLFQEAQKAFSSGRRRPPHRSPGHRYRLSGLIRCGSCGRRMQGQQNHHRPYYRCRFPDQYGIGEAQHPRNVYVKEKAVMPGLDRWLASLFDQEHVEETCQVLAGASQPDPEQETRQAALAEQIRDCDRRLGQYQAVLDEGADPQIVARWMAQVQRERRDLETQLGRPVPGGKLTAPQVRALVEALRDIVAVLAEADPEDKAELYSGFGVNLTSHPEGRVTVQMKPRGVKVRVGGGTPTRFVGFQPWPLDRVQGRTSWWRCDSQG